MATLLEILAIQSMSEALLGKPPAEGMFACLQVRQYPNTCYRLFTASVSLGRVKYPGAQNVFGISYPMKFDRDDMLSNITDLCIYYYGGQNDTSSGYHTQAYEDYINVRELNHILPFCMASNIGL
jgi:hypothetical protein